MQRTGHDPTYDKLKVQYDETHLSTKTNNASTVKVHTKWYREPHEISPKRVQELVTTA